MASFENDSLRRRRSLINLRDNSQKSSGKTACSNPHRRNGLRVFFVVIVIFLSTSSFTLFTLSVTIVAAVLGRHNCEGRHGQL